MPNGLRYEPYFSQPDVHGTMEIHQDQTTSRQSLWTGSHMCHMQCKHSGGWLVEVGSQQALFFFNYSEIILCLDLAPACS